MISVSVVERPIDAQGSARYYFGWVMRRNTDTQSLAQGEDSGMRKTRCQTVTPDHRGDYKGWVYQCFGHDSSSANSYTRERNGHHNDRSPKYRPRAAALRTWTANSPASTMAHSSYMPFRAFRGSWRDGSVDNSCTKREYGSLLTTGGSSHTVFRTSRTTDSIDPRFSVPSLTYARHI